MRRGLREGHFTPLGVFPSDGGGDEVPDLALRVAGGPDFAAAVPPENAVSSVDAALAIIDRAVAQRTAPFGVVERPLENAEVSPGEWSFGWALDDSGMAGVTVRVEGGTPVPCAIHTPFPGVEALYGKYPDAKLPGFGCPVPAAPEGSRVLLYELVGNDGGRTIVKRAVRMRPK